MDALRVLADDLTGACDVGAELLPGPAGVVVQPASEGRLQFQVASIKRNPAANTFFQIMPQRSGRFVATAATLRRLILFAYQVRDFQVVGGPKWLDVDLWDVNAAGEPAGPEAVPDTGGLAWMNPSRLRLRTLLEDRFQLRVHTESREMPLFELRVSKDGSRLRRRLPPVHRTGRRRFRREGRI